VARDWSNPEATLDSFEYVVGDINSQERGSGARANGGKARLDLIPVAIWAKLWACDISQLDEGDKNLARDLLTFLQRWQEGETFYIGHAVDVLRDFYPEAVQVFEYGMHKYAAWNWAKGMAWSIPLGCVLRHLESIIVHKQFLDFESGLPHAGHVLCNLIMLQHYRDHYPEGDDRPVNVFSNRYSNITVTCDKVTPEYDKTEWGDTDVYLERLRAQGHREECTGL
jgi:hypothetical protein